MLPDLLAQYPPEEMVPGLEQMEADGTTLEDAVESLEEALEEASVDQELLEKELISDVLSKYADILSECERWHEYIERCRKLYLLWHHDDDELYSVTLSRPHNVVTFAKSVLLTADYHPEALSFEYTEDAERRQSLLEKFALALWDTNEDRAPWPVRDQFITNLLVDGSAWMQVYLDPTHTPPVPIVPEWPDQPITFEVVDTLQVYPCLSQSPRRPFDYIITKHTEKLSSLMLQWPDKDWSKHSQAYQDPEDIEVEVFNYSGYDDDGNVVQVICTDKVLLANDVLWHQDEYPYLPWVVAGCYTGMPTREVEGAGVSLIAKFQSILHTIDDTVATAENILAGDLRALDLYGNMPPVVKTQAGRPVNIDPDWGNVITLQLGEEIGFPQWPGNPPDSTRIMQFLLADMQEATFSAAAMGYPGASASGYQVSLTIEASRSRLYLPARSFARAIKQATDLALQYLRKYLPLTVIQAYGVGPDGRYQRFGFHPLVAEGLRLECRPKLTMPGDEVRKTAIAQQWAAMGLPMDLILSDVLDYKQPDEILRRMRAQKAESHPIVQILTLIEALQAQGSPYVPILVEALRQVVGNQVKQATQQAAPQGFRPPGQEPGMTRIGQQVAPLAMTDMPTEFNPMANAPLPPI